MSAMPAPEPQSILDQPTSSAIFLVLAVEGGDEDAIREFLADVNGLRRSVGFRVPEAGLSCVTGIGAQLWDRLFGPPRPADLHVLPEIAGARHVSVSTPGDLLFHIRAARLDLCFELAQRLTEGSRATPASSTRCTVFAPLTSGISWVSSTGPRTPRAARRRRRRSSPARTRHSPAAATS
jgi:deferrochelatase/peroxidase EfeB